MPSPKPKPYEWDFDGACAPGNAHGRYETFTLGIFQWIPKASGKGLKRGKVIRRVEGRTDSPDEVFARAQTIVDQMNRTEPDHA